MTDIEQIKRNARHYCKYEGIYPHFYCVIKGDRMFFPKRNFCPYCGEALEGWLLELDENGIPVNR